MRWIDRMRNNATRAPGKFLAPARSRNRGRRAGENGFGCDEPVKLGKQILLRCERLSDVFLHIAGAGSSLGQGGHRRDSPARHRGLLVEQTCRLEIGERAIDQDEAFAQRFGIGIVQSDRVPGAREDDRPRPTNQSGADDRDLRLVSAHRWTPTLAASLVNSAAALPPNAGAQLAPWGGPTALIRPATRRCRTPTTPVPRYCARHRWRERAPCSRCRWGSPSGAATPWTATVACNRRSSRRALWPWRRSPSRCAHLRRSRAG